MIKASPLVQHALSNIWCNPGQDNQVIIQPARISTKFGAINSTTAASERVLLPDPLSIYHVFQIGSINPLVLGIFNNTNLTTRSWTSLADVCNAQHITVNVYSIDGICIPLHSVFYYYTANKDLVLAVKQISIIPIDYAVDTLYIRLYTNAFYQTNSVPANVNVFGSVMRTLQDIATFVMTCGTYTALPSGLLSVYINGAMALGATNINIKVGDVVEAVYDASVLKVVEIPLSMVRSFNSIKDGKAKYLIHYPDDGLNYIEYFDDNDLYITYKANAIHQYGVYYHNNAVDATRMVTHRDYSIAVDYVTSHISALQKKYNPLGVVSNGNVRVKLIIRKPAIVKPITTNGQLINELYKLPDSVILDCMSNANAGPTIWTAPALENSGYCGVMAKTYRELVSMGSNLEEYVLSAYTLNNLAVLNGDLPIRPVAINGLPTINLPISLQNNSTIYEYDVNGLYLGFYPMTASTVYHPVNPSCALVEVLSGNSNLYKHTHLHRNLTLNQINKNIQVGNTITHMSLYIRTVDINGLPTSAWSEYTSIYSINPDRLGYYLVVPPYSEIICRNDSGFTSYDTIINNVGGVYGFTLSEMIDVNGVAIPHASQQPLLHLDIILNGYSLVEGVDYLVQHPNVTIINTKYLLNNATGPQSIHVRYLGTHVDPVKCYVVGGTKDVGWTEYNYLSNNNKYDITAGRVLRITVGGKLLGKSDVVFSENHSGVSTSNIMNGLPYQVCAMPIKINKFFASSPTIGIKTILYSEITYGDEANLYKNISNFMTTNDAQPPRVGPSVIPALYKVYSPFIAAIINALTTNTITVNALMPNLTDMDILTLCGPYEHWLSMDHINPNRGIDRKFVTIAPHPHSTVMQLSFFQYRFLTNVVRLYGNGLITLSPSVVLI